MWYSTFYVFFKNMESIQHVPEVLVKEEEKAVGVVSFSVYRAYWSAVGLFLAPLIMLSLLLMQGGWALNGVWFWLHFFVGSRNISDWWLTYWITHANSSNSSSDLEFSTASSSNSSSDLEFFLGIYGGLAAANSVSATHLHASPAPCGKRSFIVHV